MGYEKLEVTPAGRLILKISKSELDNTIDCKATFLEFKLNDL